MSAPPAAKPSIPVALPVAQPVAQPVHKSSGSSSSSSSSASDLIDARLILDMPATKAYTLVDGSKRLVEDGKLEVMSSEVDGEEVYILILGKVKLALRLHVPCLEMASRSFVFPTDSGTYGIVIADAITDEVLDVFRILLTEHTSFRTAANPQPISSLPDRPDKVVSAANSVAAGLGAGSVVVATGVIKGGRLVGEFLTKGGAYLTSRLKPNEKPTTVSDKTKSKLQKAKFLSGAACKVSKALVVGAMATTEMMSKQLSEAIKETDVGKKLASDPEHPNERLDAAKHVGKSAIGAVLHVYQAIETAVFGVAHDAAAATVTVVTHKYGEDAGKHTKEGLGVVENVAIAAHSMNQLGVKAIAKKTAIKAGQEVLTTPAEREAAQREAAAKAAQAGPSSVIGQALGLPPGVDPLQAVEAMQAAAALSSAAAPYMAQSAAHPGQDQVTVTTAVATGTTQAEAKAAAVEAAREAAAKK